MIESLHISNYALIDEIDIGLKRGFNVITGETGAGKSIIMGALSLILGGRADSKVVGNPEKKSVIEAVFTIDEFPSLRRFCIDNDIDIIDAEFDNRLILRREIAPAGRSRAFINDNPVPVTKLQELAIHLVDIHSQHQNLLLAQPDFQLSIIDNLAANAPLRASYQERYNELREAMRALKRTKAAIEKIRGDEEFTRFQLEQLDKLAPVKGEQEELERERDEQENMSFLKGNVRDALLCIADDNQGAIARIEAALDNCIAVEQLFSKDDDLAARFDNILTELRDIAATLENTDADLYANPDGLDAVNARLAELEAMQRRHHLESADELVDLQARLRKTLDLLENADNEIASLEKRARAALAAARSAAVALSESRHKQAAMLSAEIKKRAVPLGMKNLECEIRVSPDDLKASGADKVEFLFSFNKNQELMPIGKTASGGEISRIMLSIKAIIAEHIQLPSLILDEIDTGVSGEVANRMGELMQSIGSFSQVIAITHLPQVASKGDSHYKVFKEDDETSTHTRIRQLSDDERVNEIALMLSGKLNDHTAIAAAKSLLDNSNKTE